jgi:hypothetical protein
LQSPQLLYLQITPATNHRSPAQLQVLYIRQELDFTPKDILDFNVASLRCLINHRHANRRSHHCRHLPLSPLLDLSSSPWLRRRRVLAATCSASRDAGVNNKLPVEDFFPPASPTQPGLISCATCGFSSFSPTPISLPNEHAAEFCGPPPRTQKTHVGQACGRPKAEL